MQRVGLVEGREVTQLLRLYVTKADMYVSNGPRGLKCSLLFQQDTWICWIRLSFIKGCTYVCPKKPC